MASDYEIVDFAILEQLAGNISLYWLAASISLMFQVIAILDKIKNEKKGSERKEQLDSSAAQEEDNDWDDEDSDQGIIYVD